MKRNKKIIYLLLVVAFLLMVPWWAGAPWSKTDYLVAGALVLGMGLLYEFVVRKGRNIVYRIAFGLILATELLLIWINLAVGIIGSENHPANLLYGGVIALGLTGALLARFQPLGMARASVAMALTQALVPLIALMIWKSQITWTIFGANAFFALLFFGAAWLFRCSSLLDKK